jgi:hypothetical protein
MSLAGRLLTLRDHILRNDRTGAQVEGELHAIIFQIGPESPCASYIKDALDYAEDHYDGGNDLALDSLVKTLAAAAECLEGGGGS